MNKLLVLCCAWLCACGTPVPEPAGDPAAVQVAFEPASDSSHVASVVHLHVASSSLGSADVSLYQGTVSSYYLGKLKQGEVPSTLATRRVPLVSWRAAGELIAAPTQALALGQYSLVSMQGLLGEFKVSAAAPLLARLWPPAGAGSPRFAVYCGDSASSTPVPSSGSLSFAPRALSVQVLPGVGEGGPFAERCLHFTSDAQLEPEEILVPPPQLADWALGPGVFSAADQPVTPLVCEAGEGTLTPGCASIADDRIVVRTPAAPLLWIVHTAHGSSVEVTRAGSPLSVVGLLPGSRERVWGSVHDTAGSAVEFDFAVDTAPARERPILNEALADALGREPQAEWVELCNDGTLAVDLAGYALQDGGGRSVLPHALLGPKQYALIVREDFAPNGGDEPPALGTLLIRVPTLGKSGLSNSGERLALIDTSGAELSVLPALSGKAGQSLARRSPSARDDDAEAFTFGTPTPGSPNTALP